MHIPFPGPNERVLCEDCLTELEKFSDASSECDTAEDYFCPCCVDFVGVIIVPDLPPQS